ncbi:MAG: hypothetical protein O3A82_04930 [Verrucomicrobia bacterium]|nr:hypothetical protein [Verrucomicrobiota bacterium]
MKGGLKEGEKVSWGSGFRLFFLLRWHLLKTHPVEDPNPPPSRILCVQVRLQGLEIQPALGHIRIVAIKTMHFNKGHWNALLGGNVHREPGQRNG